MAMGLGGHLAARSEAEHCAREEARERRIRSAIQTMIIGGIAAAAAFALARLVA